MWNLGVHRINPNGVILSTPKFLEWVMCHGKHFYRIDPFWVDSVKMSQPIHDGFGANTNRLPKETIESTLLGQFYDQNCGKS
jgi:hypothetical protein